MTLQDLLAQALGMGTDEPTRFAAPPESYRTRGALSPQMQPDWVQGLPRRYVQEYRTERRADAPAPPRVRNGVDLPQMPRQARDRSQFYEAPFPGMGPMHTVQAGQRVIPQGHPGAYQNFASYAQDAPRVRLGALASAPVEPPQAPPQGVGGYSINPATGGAMRGPADAYGMAPASEQVTPMMDQHTFALMQALEQARVDRQAENEALWATLPRPGRPAIGQLALSRRNSGR